MFLARVSLAMVAILSISSISLAEKDGKKPDSPAAADEQKIERRSVSASVVSTVGDGVGIRAKKVPGEFTIPKGSTARNFRYTFHDPKKDLTLDKLTGGTIYSVTEGRYITEAAEGPNFELPPGEYKFVVGGGPGASGSLSFDVAPSDSTSVVIKDGVPEADLPSNTTVSVVIWGADRPEYKLRWDFDIKNGVVTGTGEPDSPPHPSPSIVNEKSDYKFLGRVVNKRIKGIASQKLTWDAVGHNGSRMSHVYEGEGKLELQLRIDHTVIGSETHSGRTNGESTIQNAKLNWIGKWTAGKK